MHLYACAHAYARVYVFIQPDAHTQLSYPNITKKVKEKEKQSGNQIIARSSFKSYLFKKKQMKHFDEGKDGIDR